MLICNVAYDSSTYSSDNSTLLLLRLHYILTGEKVPGGRKRGPKPSKDSDGDPKEPKKKKARRSSKASAAAAEDDDDNDDNDNDDDDDFETGAKGRLLIVVADRRHVATLML